MSEDSPMRSQHVLAFLGGQTAPLSTSGIGRRVLYRCPTCQRVWYQDGSRQRLDLEAHERMQFAQELSANLEALPLSTCRLCVVRNAGCVIDIDEYGSTDGKGKGFGFNWEAPEPVGAHLQAGIISSAWLVRQHKLEPDIVTTPKRLRAVLRWFTEITHFPLMVLFTEDHSDILARTNPPGFGMTGTAHWQWKGGLFRLPCPPLRDDALVSLSIALPRTEPLDIQELIHLWQMLAEVMLLSGITDNME